MAAYLNEVWQTLADQVPSLVIALVVLVVGWLVALIGAALTRAILKKTSLDNRIVAWAIGSEKADEVPVETAAGKVVFWILMIFTLIAFFSMLGIQEVTAPLSALLEEVFAFLPNLLSAAVLLAARQCQSPVHHPACRPAILRHLWLDRQ